MEHRMSFGDLFKKKLEYFSALIALVVFILLSISPSGSNTENSMYDTLLHLKTAPENGMISFSLILTMRQSRKLSLALGRDVIADILIRLREAGGTHAYSISSTSPGKPG